MRLKVFILSLLCLNFSAHAQTYAIKFNAYKSQVIASQHPFSRSGYTLDAQNCVITDKNHNMSRLTKSVIVSGSGDINALFSAFDNAPISPLMFNCNIIFQSEKNPSSGTLTCISSDKDDACLKDLAHMQATQFTDACNPCQFSMNSTSAENHHHHAHLGKIIALSLLGVGDIYHRYT